VVPPSDADSPSRVAGCARRAALIPLHPVRAIVPDALASRPERLDRPTAASTRWYRRGIMWCQQLGRGRLASSASLSRRPHVSAWGGDFIKRGFRMRGGTRYLTRSAKPSLGGGLPRNRIGPLRHNDSITQRKRNQKHQPEGRLHRDPTGATKSRASKSPRTGAKEHRGIQTARPTRQSTGSTTNSGADRIPQRRRSFTV